MTKRFFFLSSVIAMGLSASAWSASYKIDPAHSSIEFEVRHLVSKVKGNFKEFEGTFDYDQKKPADLKLVASAKASTVDTRNDKRDEHLRSADFFNVEKFPTINFESKKLVAVTKGKKYKVPGDFTMLGVTKPVVFNVEYLGEATDPQGNERAGLVATAKINRKDFGMVWNKGLDKGGFILGDDVTITINLETIKEKAEKPAEKSGDKKDEKKSS